MIRCDITNITVPPNTSEYNITHLKMDVLWPRYTWGLIEGIFLISDRTKVDPK